MTKVQNIHRNSDKIYFSIDEDNYSYNEVKGRAVTKISRDKQKNLRILEKVNIKYLDTIELPLAKMIMEIKKWH